jgi:hypothetical protein
MAAAGPPAANAGAGVQIEYTRGELVLRVQLQPEELPPEPAPGRPWL